MITKIGFWMLLLACCAAFEMYDENRAFGMDQNGEENYNEENYDYQDFGPYWPEIHDDPVQDLMLYQLFNSLQNRDDARLRMHYRPKFSMVKNSLASFGHVPYNELMDFKGVVAKRHSDAPGSVPVSAYIDEHKVKSSNQKQSKLKDENVRKGLVWVCYFKLCAFRPPV